MTRIINFRSKLSIKYDTDLWGFLIRKKPKITKATKLFNTVNTSHNAHIGSELFSRITFKLHVKRLKKRNSFYKCIRNRARLRIFLGNINNRSLKNFSRLCWFRLADKFRVGTIFESRIDFILYRLNFALNLKESRQIIKDEVVKKGNKVIKDYRDRLALYSILNLGYDFPTRLYFYKRLFLRMLIQPKTILQSIPTYFEINWRLLEIVLVRSVDIKKSFFPFSVDIERAVNYYKTHSK